MMKFKKFAFAALAGAMAFGMANASGVQAMAETPTPAAAAFDAGKMTVTLTKASDDATPHYYYFEVLKGNTADSKVAASYCLTGNKVDVSFIKLSKEAYVRFYTDTKTTPSAIITLKAQPKAPKVKYVPGKDDFNASFTLNGTPLTDTTKATLQYFDTVGGTWEALSGLNLGQYVITGKELKVRLKATNDTPASVETKVKIPAAKKAPSVKTDYVKGVINFPKGTEAMVIGANDNGKFTYAFTDKATLTPAEFKEKYDAALAKKVGNNQTVIDASKDYNVFVRTAAIADKSNPSQWAMVTVKKAPTIAKVADKAMYGDEKSSYVTYEAKADGLHLNATYAAADKFQFAYSIDGTKWTAIKSGSDVKIAYSKFAKMEFYLRKNGVKEDLKKKIEGSWPSASTAAIAFTAPAKTITISGDAEIKTEGATEYAYTAAVKDVLGKDMTNPTIVWSASGTKAEEIVFNAETHKLTVTKQPTDADATVKITATVKGTEVSATYEVVVKKKVVAAP